VSLNDENVSLFSGSMSGCVCIRSCPQMCLSSEDSENKYSVQDLGFLCLAFECLCQNILKGKRVLKHSEIQHSSKVSLPEQSGSNVYISQQPRKSRVRHCYWVATTQK